VSARAHPRLHTGVKRRVRGSAAEACAKAWAEAGGVKVVEAESGLKARRLYAAADPDANHGDKPLTWEEVVRLTRDLHLTAFADALAALNGGVVLDGGDTRAPATLAPLFSQAAGEVVTALLDGRTESAGLALDRALKAGAALRAALTLSAAQKPWRDSP
jgi:hypothetical protein